MLLSRFCCFVVLQVCLVSSFDSQQIEDDLGGNEVLVFRTRRTEKVE